MASDVQAVANWKRSPVRFLMWGFAAFLLALPAVAMQFTTEVQWDPMDFLVMGSLLALACGLVEVGAGLSDSRTYRLAVSLTVLTGFLLIWVNLAVGVIGHSGNPANLMFLGVLAVAGGGAVMARGRAPGMAVAMAGAGTMQVAIHAAAYFGGLGSEEPSSAGWRVFVLGLGFAAMWWVSAALFRTAAKTP